MENTRRLEEGRSKLRQVFALFENEQPKKDCEKEKLRAENERMCKEKESDVRVSLENEISSLKSEVLSLTQQVSSVREHASAELKHLQGRVSEKEKELKRLQEEKKRADQVCANSKAEKKKVKAEMEQLKKDLLNEKKKAEEQKKIAEMNTKHALEEKQRADMFKQQAVSEKARADKLVKEKLKLEKERVKHADKVVEHEKKSKKVAEEEIHQLKLEFARFSSRIGLGNCFSVGKSCIEKDGNVNSKRTFAHPTNGEVLLLPTSAATKTSESFESSLDCPASSLPISRNCTESASGTASIMEPLFGDSNKNSLDTLALVSRMPSFSDRQGICGLSASKENSNLHLSSEANNNVKSPLTWMNQDGNAKKRKRLVNNEVVLGLQYLTVRNQDGNSKKRKRLINNKVETGHEKIAKILSPLHGSVGNTDKPLTEGTQIVVESIEKNRELGVRSIGDEVIDNSNVKSPLTLRNQDGKINKRKRLVSKKGETGHEKIAKILSPLHGSVGNMDKPLTEGTEVSVESIEKNGELGVSTVGDEDIDYDATHTAFERPPSPTLPTIKLQSSQLVELDDSGPSQVTCNIPTVNTNGDSLVMLGNSESGNTISALIPTAGSQDQDSIVVTENSDLGHTGTKTSSGNEPGSAYDDSSHYIVVFPEIKDGGSLSKILDITKKFTTQCCALSQSEVIIKDVVRALSTNDVLSPKEKVCAFFSLFLKSFSSIASTKFNNLNDENFLNSIDVFSAQLKNVIIDEEIRTMFTNVCDLGDLLTLTQNFIINGRVLHPVDIDSETLPSPDSEASLHQLVLGALLLASLCAAFDCIEVIFKTSHTISSLTSSSTLMFLHVFANVCGEKLLAHGDYSLIMTVVKSLVAYREKEKLSTSFHLCAKCPFSDGAVSMEKLAVLLLKQLSRWCMNNLAMTTYKSDTVLDEKNLQGVVFLLKLLASTMSWRWVCKNIVRELLKFSEVCVVDTSLMAVYVSLGGMARLGVASNGYQDAKVENIRVKLSSFISQSTSSKTGLGVQLAAVNAFLVTTPLSFQEICNLSPLESTSTGTDCIQKWFSLLSDEKKHLLSRLFSR